MENNTTDYKTPKSCAPLYYPSLKDRGLDLTFPYRPIPILNKDYANDPTEGSWTHITQMMKLRRSVFENSVNEK